MVSADSMSLQHCPDSMAVVVVILSPTTLPPVSSQPRCPTATHCHGVHSPAVMRQLTIPFIFLNAADFRSAVQPNLCSTLPIV